MLFVFGQAERGLLCHPVLCREILDLLYQFGHPPAMTSGLFFAIQSITLQTPCVFFRVEEEGFSHADYLRGLNILKNHWKDVPIQAIGLPGVGDVNLIEKAECIFTKKRTLLLLNEKDLFDFLTS